MKQTNERQGTKYRKKKNSNYFLDKQTETNSRKVEIICVESGSSMLVLRVACFIATFNIWYRFLLWSCTRNQIRKNIIFFSSHLFAQSIHKWDIFPGISINSQIETRNEHTHRIERMYFVSVSPRRNTRVYRDLYSRSFDDKRTTKFRLTRTQNFFFSLEYFFLLFVWKIRKYKIIIENVLFCCVWFHNRLKKIEKKIK